MELYIRQRTPGCADGVYQVTASGCIAASLHWADENGALADWSPLAYVPIAPNGVGKYTLEGARAIPREATHVLARAVSADFSHVEEAMTPVQRETEGEWTPGSRFLVMTDLHLSRKPWKVKKALSMAAGYDAVLITGDMVTDGTQTQLERFYECVEECAPGVPVLAVTGNHDQAPQPLPFVGGGIPDYNALQEKLLTRAEKLGVAVTRDITGAYAARMGDVEILGINAVGNFRRFRFPEGQLSWLFWQLQESTARRCIVLCHAPLLHHRPYLGPQDAPYLSRDRELQRIVDVQGPGIAFLSGHTHVSLNCREGCAQLDARGNLYINAGSIRPTALKPDEALQPECWTEGNVVALTLTDAGAEVKGISTKTGQGIARGYYRLPFGFRKAETDF